MISHQAFQMTDGMVIAICGVLTCLLLQISAIVMFLLKAREDRIARAEAHENIEDVKSKGAAREDRIVSHVEEVKTIARANGKKAEIAYKEANSVNLKLESLGIQTKEKE